jgi:hypothetical protein
VAKLHANLGTSAAFLRAAAHQSAESSAAPPPPPEPRGESRRAFAAGHGVIHLL